MLVLGLMSGTSLDGLDLALCEFGTDESGYSYKILAAKTVEYSAIWKKRLTGLKQVHAEEYFALHAAYGRYMAEEIILFLKAADVKAGLIASHGHTVFHQPNQGFTTQLGCGATIAAHTGIPTVCDFRSLDVGLNGQGAPLVPVGDKLLFGEYEACLNIGGIANISYDDARGQRIAYDICEANMLLNYLAEFSDKPFDKGGEMARSGKIDLELLDKLDRQEYYSKKGAKSLGREWFEEYIEKLIDKKGKVIDLLATSVEHISGIIASELNALKIKNVLVTGGGAFNTFLIEQIRSKTKCQVILPNEKIINFKEALIFAFLGYLRVNQKINTLCSVTGASRDSIGGAVYIA